MQSRVRRDPGRAARQSDSDCMGALERFSLGHELATDVVHLQFPMVYGEWDAYSVACAILQGTGDTSEVPDNGLNVTTTGGERPGESAVVLSNNVTGAPGAGGAAGKGRGLRRRASCSDGARAKQSRLRLKLLRLPPELPQSVRARPVRPDSCAGDPCAMERSDA